MSMSLYLCTLEVWVLLSFAWFWLQFVLDDAWLTEYSTLDSILTWSMLVMIDDVTAVNRNAANVSMANTLNT
jgi:hypothetical protein